MSTNAQLSPTFGFVRSSKRCECRLNKRLSSSRAFHFNRELHKREEQQVETCPGSRSGQGQLRDWFFRSGLVSFLFSPRRLWKQQQVWSAEHGGPERVLRRGGERLSESAVLWAPAPLQHPHPGQLWAGGHHRHQAAQVHVLLLPLLSTRGERNHFGSRFCSSLVVFGGSEHEPPPSLPHSWRCRLPPVTQWATSYNSGTLSPLNSSWLTSTTSRFWRSTGPSADGAASQRSTSRWVQPNSHIDNTRPLWTRPGGQWCWLSSRTIAWVAGTLYLHLFWASRWQRVGLQLLPWALFSYAGLYSNAAGVTFPLFPDRSSPSMKSVK